MADQGSNVRILDGEAAGEDGRGASGARTARSRGVLEATVHPVADDATGGTAGAATIPAVVPTGGPASAVEAPSIVTDRRPRAGGVGSWLASRRRGVLLAVLGLAAAVALVASRVDLGGVVVDGLSVGSVYALVALGIALVYRSTRVLNFAQGELGTVPAFVVLMVLTGFDRAATLDPSTVGLGRLVGVGLAGVLVGALLAVGVNTVIVQRLEEANPVTSLVATAGVSLLLVGGQIVVFGLSSRRFPRVLDGSACFVDGTDGCLLQTNRHNLVILAVLVVVGAALALLFRTQLGTALLATAQDPFAAALHGVSPRAMSSLAWGLAGALGALGGILGAGYFAGLTPGLMTSTFLVPAFTAAVLGGITSMTGAVVGGLLLGLVAALANGVATTYGLTSVVPSPPTLASFTVLLVVLLVRPRGLFGQEA